VGPPHRLESEVLTAIKKQAAPYGAACFFIAFFQTFIGFNYNFVKLQFVKKKKAINRVVGL
jgi:hypothetical protein